METMSISDHSAAAEDDSANNWKSALESEAGDYDETELVWYSSQTPEYPSEPTPAQTEAARRFVSHWLEGDNHGFIIPGSEWGRSMKHWMHILVRRSAPGAEAIVDPEVTWTPIAEIELPLVEQVRNREIGPNQWIQLLVYEKYSLGERSDEEIEEALAEARRMRQEDEDETRKTLGHAW
jgi:hypothetical protein